ncbi:MAG: hypothetical protein K2O24_07335 [Muribaculaceae bacterium]|nr:hypothetical protein [Muribaculaceae bacterium]
MPRFYALLLTLLICIFGGSEALAWNATYYAKAVAKPSDTGGGKVYASATADAPADDAYVDTESVAENNEKKNGNSGSAPATANVTFYLYAQPDEGQMLHHWEDETGKNVGSNNPQSVTIAAANGNETDPTTMVYTAFFKEASALLLSTDQPELGTVGISKLENGLGDTVTLTATIKSQCSYQTPNLMTKFAGWFDQDGNCLSTEKKFTLTITEKMKVKGVFEVPKLEDGGYYRILSFTGRPMTVNGNYSWNFTNGTSLDGMLTWTTPRGYDYSYAHNVPLWSCLDEYEVETMPSTIIRLTGEVDGGSMTNAVAHCQGTDTKTMTGKVFTIAPHPASPSYLHITNGNLALKYKPGTSKDVEFQGKTVSALQGLVEVGNSSATSPGHAYEIMAIQPLTEENVDDYWFGVHPSEETLYDGGYWASMYTSFPYRCHEPDGVEAYYIKSCKATDGVNYAHLTKIEDGIVPEYSAVLLKCKGHESSKQNRLIPLNVPDGTYPALEGNMLVGEFQLRNDKTKPTYATFDSSKMRVLNVDEAGNVGFYNIAEGTQLSGNMAYLDLSLIPAAQRNMPIRISALAADESAAANAAANAAGSEPSIKGYFRIQNVAETDGDAGYINVTGPFTARPVLDHAQATSAPGTVMYVEAYPATINGKACHKIMHLRSQGIDLFGEPVDDFMTRFEDIFTNTTGNSSLPEELMWSMVRHGFTDGYTSVARVALEGMFVMVASRLADEMDEVTSEEMEDFAKRFATEVADKINLNFYLEPASDGSFHIFYDMPTMDIVSEWYLKDENKTLLEYGMEGLRRYFAGKTDIGSTGETFTSSEVAEMKGWGYDITAYYPANAEGEVESSYEAIFADPTLLFNWLKLSIIKFTDPERCPDIEIKGMSLRSMAQALNSHQLTSMMIGYLPDIQPGGRYYITNGKGSNTAGLLDFSNQEHLDGMDGYGKWLFKPVTAEDDAYFCVQGVGEQDELHYAAVYLDFPVVAADASATKLYTLSESPLTVTVNGVDIEYYDLVEFAEGEAVAAQTPMIVEMTTAVASAHRLVPDCELVWNPGATAPEEPEDPEDPTTNEVKIPVSNTEVAGPQRIRRRAAGETTDFTGVLLDTPISPEGFALRWNKEYSPMKNPVHVLRTNALAGTQSGIWFEKKTSGTLPANTAVLMQPTSAINAFKVGEPVPDNETLVIGTESENTEDVIYDLRGMRVSNPVSGCIYIVNGKKVLVK